MLPKTNLEKKLHRVRDKRIASEDILTEVEAIFRQNEIERAQIKQRLQTKIDAAETRFNTDLLEASNVFHITDIKKICVEYRLRFLDSHFFKKEIPEEAISKIRQLEKEHDSTFNSFKIVAPAKLLKLENADDPLLFLPLGNDYFYLIHKWGNDLHPLRKWLMWPYKCFENLVFTVFVLSILLTAITPLHLFTHGEVTNQEYLLMFLFMFKSVGGIVLFYGFAKGKNFNNAIWNSKYYNA
ncbi:hypothetical protein [Marinirhabdus gelatinilytica]|uniref:Uncharacterized protein n=1 Tax=Marinirhabdus gelatinilytica TaxID=1703343 RepID=A0A370QAM8_9FLAO|nr:hypothetical protein [Marinirhabdus gelatinilytica]RDK85434.1 hypothetical protein C8D94_103259 [Marinirhabdus gelatinilytica]